jgi:diketogulonate reductase-like aldo/keto reductase
MYGSEEMVGEAIRGIPRGELFLVSKVHPQNATRAGTIRACEASLRRLGVDHLDVYLLHWRGAVPLAETMGGLQTLVSQGKIRALGVSNFDVGDLEEAAAALGDTPIACNQGPLSPGPARRRRTPGALLRGPQHRRGRVQPVRPRAISARRLARAPRAG